MNGVTNCAWLIFSCIFRHFRRHICQSFPGGHAPEPLQKASANYFCLKLTPPALISFCPPPPPPKTKICSAVPGLVVVLQTTNKKFKVFLKKIPLSQQSRTQSLQTTNFYQWLVAWRDAGIMAFLWILLEFFWSVLILQTTSQKIQRKFKEIPISWNFSQRTYLQSDFH